MNIENWIVKYIGESKILGIDINFYIALIIIILIAIILNLICWALKPKKVNKNS